FNSVFGLVVRALRAVAAVRGARERVARAFRVDEEREGVGRRVYLRVVAGGDEFVAARFDGGGDLRRAARGRRVERRGELFQTRVEWIEQDETVSRGERRHQRSEGRAVGATGRVGVAHERGQFVGELA